MHRNTSPTRLTSAPLTFFMASRRLSDNISSLGEVLFIAQSDNSVGLDVERLLLQYRQSDDFTALGWPIPSTWLRLIWL